MVQTNNFQQLFVVQIRYLNDVSAQMYSLIQNKQNMK